MKKLSVLLIISLVVNILFITGAGFVVYKKGGVDFIKSQINAVASTQEYPDYYLQKKSVFEATEIEEAGKVFIGDSITDHGEFQEYFTGTAILNRGISNDNAKGVLNRIEEVVQRNPKEVYIMIGVNDILYSTDLEEYKKNVTNIIKAFSDTNAKVFLQSILPVNNEIYGDAVSNETVTQFNDALKSISSEMDITYLDLNSSFADSDGQLKKEFTIDGIHLTGAGYEEWMKHIKQLEQTVR